jgi:sugar phosphate isomerase/epimerase
MIALSTGSLFTYGIARVATLAAAAGFDGLEIMVDDRWDTRDAAYLQAVADAAGIPILSVHAPFRPGIQGWDEDEVSRLKRTVDLARAVGASMVVVHPPLRFSWIALRYPPFINMALLTPIPRRSRYRRWLAAELERYRARAGVTIAVENMPRHRLGPRLVNIFDMNEIRDLRHFPAITLDTTHIGTWGVDLLDTYEVLADRVVHVHLSNYNGRQHRLPHDGSLALAPFLAALRRRRFAGVIVVELEPDSAGAGDEAVVHDRLVKSAAFCREHFR